MLPQYTISFIQLRTGLSCAVPQSAEDDVVMSVDPNNHGYDGHWGGDPVQRRNGPARLCSGRKFTVASHCPRNKEAAAEVLSTREHHNAVEAVTSGEPPRNVKGRNFPCRYDLRRPRGG